MGEIELIYLIFLLSILTSLINELVEYFIVLSEVSSKAGVVCNLRCLLVLCQCCSVRAKDGVSLRISHPALEGVYGLRELLVLQ